MTDRPPLVMLASAAFGYDRRKKPVVTDISFSASSGEFIVMRGPNGCGKSTVIKGILGIARLVAGSMRWNIDPTDAGYVPQESPISGDIPYTVLDIVRCGVRSSWRGSQEAARSALSEVGLEDRRHLRFGELSGGQKRRALLARALAGTPRLLILDEPTANVDLQTEKVIDGVIRNLTAVNDAAVIAVAHSADFGRNAREIRIGNGGRNG